MLQVIARVSFHLLGREARPGLVAAARIADQGGVIADDQHRLVAELLKKAQLAQWHGMAEVNINPRWINAILDAERLAGLYAALQFLAQLGLRNNLVNAAANHGDLFVNGFHRPLLRAMS